MRCKVRFPDFGGNCWLSLQHDRIHLLIYLAMIGSFKTETTCLKGGKLRFSERLLIIRYSIWKFVEIPDKILNNYFEFCWCGSITPVTYDQYMVLPTFVGYAWIGNYLSDYPGIYINDLLRSLQWNIPIQFTTEWCKWNNFHYTIFQEKWQLLPSSINSFDPGRCNQKQLFDVFLLYS